jgi:hypothetical protein
MKLDYQEHYILENSIVQLRLRKQADFNSML